MPRQNAGVEFINTLKSIYEFKSNREFAAVCGVHETDMSSYLSGNKTPGIKVLAKCVKRIGSFKVYPLKEIDAIPDNLNTVPAEPGIYVIYDSGGNVIYIGKATNFRSEVRQTLKRKLPYPIRLGRELKSRRPIMEEIAKYISLYKISSGDERSRIESMLLRIMVNQTHNQRIGHFVHT